MASNGRPCTQNVPATPPRRPLVLKERLQPREIAGPSARPRCVALDWLALGRQHGTNQLRGITTNPEPTEVSAIVSLLIPSTSTRTRAELPPLRLGMVPSHQGM